MRLHRTPPSSPALFHLRHALKLPILYRASVNFRTTPNMFRPVIVVLIFFFLALNVSGAVLKLPLAALVDVIESQCFPAACYGECPDTHPLMKVRALINLHCECCKEL
uniref:Pollen coat protein B6 n=1 Tax=Steinernema glaseri TaxID=37863 RepID=A0A1I8ADZ6_9BILA